MTQDFMPAPVLAADTGQTSLAPDWPSLGVELEMPVAEVREGQTHCVQDFFENLRAIWSAREVETRLDTARGRSYALHSPRGLHSLDNAYNNLESSLGPVPSGPRSLDDLAAAVGAELADVDQALAREGAMVINFSEHPRVRVDDAFYFSARAPKSIYDYQIRHRGWNHQSGFDAKAHNSPCVDVPVEQAIEALNCLLALAPAFIALYANSPFEAGRITGFKENRLSIWPRQLDCSRMPGDHKLHRTPPRPFRDLADYFTWMFGPGTQMWHVARDGGGKNPGQLGLVPDDPPLLDFLRRDRWTARLFDTGKEIEVRPGMDHLVAQQFTQYTDCRLRYGLRAEGPDLGEFMAVLDHSPRRLTQFLAPYLSHCYLEARAPGANFPDQELCERDPGKLAASVCISPTALHYGLVRNLDQACRLVDRHGWQNLLGLREEARRHGLQAGYNGIQVTQLCAQVLEMAGQGLADRQAWMLAYPLWVLRTGQTGADRALARLEKLRRIPSPCGYRGDPLGQLIRERRMVPA
jgi:hypothetical protein